MYSYSLKHESMFCDVPINESEFSLILLQTFFIPAISIIPQSFTIRTTYRLQQRVLRCTVTSLVIKCVFNGWA
jgi:hypothetical protein